MALMPGLQINMGQQLKLTPQLQQSIKILQYSALEVQQTIEATLEANFMLELNEDLDQNTDDTEELLADTPSDELDNPENLQAEKTTPDESPIDIAESDSIKEDLEIDCNWDEVYTDHIQTSSSQGSDEYSSAENYTASEESLHDHLYWQSDIYPWSDEESVIASYLIDDINEEGYLTNTLEDLLASIIKHEPEIKASLPQIEHVLSTIQQFEPTGVGARSVQESLLLQLSLKSKTPFVVTAIQLITEHFDWLSFHDSKRIKKMYALDDNELTQVLKLIQTLNPRPGRDYSSTQSEVIVPDLRLRRLKTGWLVELNSNAFPRLTINSAYIELASSLKNDEQSKQIKEQLVEAKGLIKSIHSRGETLLRVGKFIVEKQERFFEEGEHAMQPLVLREVADFLDLHESTISRATNQKYIQTPRGTFELKYFFSTGVSQYGSADQSAIAIKAHIKELIDGEDPKKPLSDSKLMGLLEEKEIVVARRTIAKYREALKIPSSSERKKLNQYKL